LKLVKLFFCIIFYIFNFEYKFIIVYETKHDYNIRVKVTGTYTRHQAVTPTSEVR